MEQYQPVDGDPFAASAVSLQPVSGDPFAAGSVNPQTTPQGSMPYDLQGQSISAYNPTWREKAAQWLYGDQPRSPEAQATIRGLMGTTGLGQPQMSVSDLTPLGGAFAAQEAARRGDYSGAGIAAMSVLPGAGVIDRGITEGVGAIERGAGEAVLGSRSVRSVPPSKYDTDVYHATGAQFNTFQPSAYRQATFFSHTPEGAVSGASAGANDFGGSGTGASRIIHAQVPSSEIAGLSLPPAERDWFNALPAQATDEQMTAALKDKPNNFQQWYHLYDETQQPDGSFTYIKRPMPSTTLAQAQATGRDVYGRQIPHYNPGSEKFSAEQARSQGMSGYIHQDEGGVSVGMVDPTRVQTVNSNWQPNAVPVTGDPFTPITAYHGSPHDFDAFDMSKIGTGEGAQAYGHGLYFAGNEDVAKQYQENLSRQTSFGGQPVSSTHWNDSPETAAIHAVASHVANGVDPAAAIARESANWRSAASDYARHAKDYPDAAQQADSFNQIADSIDKLDPSQFAKNPGKMYQVQINADPNHFLDWDKPLSEQHPVVQQKLQGMLGDKYWNEYRSAPGSTAVKQGFLGPGDEGAAQRLNQAGIPGIKYLDAGSRGSGTGTSNYVVFDDKIINILKKYGIGGLGIGTAAGLKHFQTQPVNGDPYAGDNGG